MRVKRKIKATIALSLILLILFITIKKSNYNTSFAQTGIKFTEKWFHTYDSFNDDLSIRDLEHDNSLEILFHAGTTLYCLDSSGRIKWSVKEKSASSALTIADINEDGKSDLVIPYLNDGILCRNHQGRKLWFFRSYTYSRYAYPCIADFNKDGNLDIIINSDNRNPFILTKKGILNQNYNLLNKSIFNPDLNVYSTPIVVDIDLNDDNELLIITADEYLYCITNNNTVVWKFKLEKIGYSLSCYSKPVLLETPQKAINVLIVDFNELLCLDSTGKLAWNFNLNESYSGYNPVSADINKDGSPEILFRAFSKHGILYCLDSNGEYLWSYTTDFFQREPILVDINGDSRMEIVFAAGKKIYCLNSSGGIEYIYENNQQSGEYRTLRMADIDNDGYLDLITATNEGELSCLEITPSSEYLSSWWTFGGTNQHYGQPDKDGDGIDDLSEELIYHTDSTNKDSDNDGLIDSWEIDYGLNPLSKDSEEDPDGDGRSNREEFLLAKNPTNWDNWTRLFAGYFSPIWLGMLVAIVNFSRQNKDTITNFFQNYRKS
ncbi:MAG: hypothetical protein ACTSX6_05670 [Candidatus Heimdallarchaeaceae archaeon]